MIGEEGSRRGRVRQDMKGTKKKHGYKIEQDTLFTFLSINE